MVDDLGSYLIMHIYRIMVLATTISVRISKLMKHKFDQS